MLFDEVHNNKNPEKVINAFELKVCTKENAKEYDGLWKKWLGKKDEKKDEKPVEKK